MDVEALVALHCFDQDLTVKKSKILHADSGLRFFAACAFGKREALEFYSEALIYEDRSREQYKTKSFKEGEMQSPVKMFLKRTNELVEGLLTNMDLITRFVLYLHFSMQCSIYVTQVTCQRTLC